MTLSYLSLMIPLLWFVGMIVGLLLPVRGMLPTALAMLVMVFYPDHGAVKPGDFEVAILDVGQGLACVVRTHAHTLIFDTGGQLYHGPDMSTLVILPYLHVLGMTHLDSIVISHPDLDHRGGLTSLVARYPESALIVDNPEFYHRGSSCHAYPDWTWDGVQFHFFSIPQLKEDKNNRSCVLKISNTAGQLLLTGDIEREAEHYLTHTYGEALHATVLVVPHHGSKTSSTFEFLTEVNPRYAVMSYGFDNRYHFPHAETLAQYHAHSVQLYNTVDHGMVRLLFAHKTLHITPFINAKR